MATYEGIDPGVDGKRGRHQIVKVRGDNDAMPGFGENLGKDRVTETWLFAFHNGLKMSITLFGIILEASLENLWIEAGCVVVVEIRNSDIFRRCPFIHRPSLVVRV